MADQPFTEGDRVRVRPEFDDLARVLGRPTRPGTVIAVYHDAVVVAEDDEDGLAGGGSSAPYLPHELERIP